MMRTIAAFVAWNAALTIGAIVVALHYHAPLVGTALFLYNWLGFREGLWLARREAPRG